MQVKIAGIENQGTAAEHLVRYIKTKACVPLCRPFIFVIRNVMSAVK